MMFLNARRLAALAALALSAEGKTVLVVKSHLLRKAR
jgi:hypothetical protein